MAVELTSQSSGCSLSSDSSFLPLSQGTMEVLMDNLHGTFNTDMFSSVATGSTNVPDGQELRSHIVSAQEAELCTVNIPGDEVTCSKSSGRSKMPYDVRLLSPCQNASTPSISSTTMCYQAQPSVTASDFAQIPSIIPVRNMMAQFARDPSPKNATAPPSISPVVPTPATSDIPSSAPYPGQYRFEIFFTRARETDTKKTISYIHSEQLNKLYVKMNVVCPVHIRVRHPPPTGARVRAMAVYSRPQDMGDAVRRCMNHSSQDHDELKDHFVRCNNAGAEYSVDPMTGRHSVLFPYSDPTPGAVHITAFYQFMCFSSCSGTINRRPTQLILTLEDCDRTILGRQVVELRICACPGRDKALDEQPPQVGVLGKRKAPPSPMKCESTSATGVVGNSAAAAVFDFDAGSNNQHLLPDNRFSDDSEEFTIKVRGRELYNLVNTIIDNYNMARNYHQLCHQMECLNKLYQQLTGVSHLTAATSLPVSFNGVSSSSTVHGSRNSLDSCGSESSRSSLTSELCVSSETKTPSLIDYLEQRQLGRHGNENLGIPSADTERLHNEITRTVVRRPSPQV